MPSRIGSYLSSPVALFVAVSFVVFAAWQAFNHIYLMHLPMFTYHAVSLVVETIGAGIVAFFVLRELARKNGQLEELDREKNMLVDALVHDLRQPLTAVIAGVDSAELDPALPEETRKVLEIARYGGTQLLGMVSDLLDVTRLEAGHPLAQFQLVKPREFVSAGIQPLIPLANGAGIELVVDAPEELPLVSGDSTRLGRVIMNLAGNALKFSPTGGRVSVSARADAARNQLVVTVTDTGQGIPKEHHKKIFDKFAMAGEREAGARSSTGLGLTFCKMVVEAHGGRIWVESNPGEGATFTFTLPIKRG